MSWYFSRRYRIDFVLALFLAFLFQYGASGFEFGFRWLPDADRVAFCSAVMGLSASLLGLVLAASTFLVGHVQHDRFKILREARSWAEFPRLVKSALWRLFALTIVTGVATVADGELFQLLAPALVFLVCLSSSAVAALVWVTSAIISIQDL